MLDLSYGAYVWLKAAHVVVAVTWVAGLIAWGEVFALAQEAGGGPCLSWCRSLMNRVVNPAAVLAVASGTVLTLTFGAEMEPWLHAKILAAAMLLAYHARLFVWFRAFAAGRPVPPAVAFRRLKVFPIVLFVGIVVCVVVRPF
ncbi:MAG: CopD family protein [Rhodospirillaceae bacterium]